MTRGVTAIIVVQLSLKKKLPKRQRKKKKRVKRTNGISRLHDASTQPPKKKKKKKYSNATNYLLLRSLATKFINMAVCFFIGERVLFAVFEPKKFIKIELRWSWHNGCWSLSFPWHRVRFTYWPKSVHCHFHAVQCSALDCMSSYRSILFVFCSLYRVLMHYLSMNI